MDKAKGIGNIFVRKVIKHIFTFFISVLHLSLVERLIKAAIKKKAEVLEHSDALRFLFRIESILYELEGRKAVEYGGGLHTKHRHIGYHEFFVSRIRPEERVLDLGCGKGEIAYDMAVKSMAQVVAIDRDKNRIAWAKEHYSHPRVEYMEGDILEGLPRGNFDVVILSNILEHISDRKGFLRLLRRELNPSRILIRAPLFERDWRVPLKKELGIDWRLDPDHKTEYTIESFREEMEDAGLAISFQEVRWGEIRAEVVPRERT